VLGAAAYGSAQLAAEDAYDRLLTGGAIQVAENIYVQGDVVSLEPPVATISSLSAYDMVYYKIVDPRGVVVAGYEDLPGGSPQEARTGVQVQNGEYQGRPIRIATAAKRLDELGADQWATIVLAQTTEARSSLTRTLALKAFALIAALSLVAIAAAAYSVSLALEPLLRIEREIAGRRPDDLRPIQTTPPLEIRALVGAIDGLMSRFSQRMQVMQRFIGDAAHQIRTPLAALDARLEVLESGAARDDALPELRSRVSDLSRLTAQLLDHAMVIHRTEAAPLVETELNAFARGVLAHAVPLSLEREVEISFDGTEGPLLARIDPVSLREALANLIDNALTHGARSALAMRVVGEPGLAVIEIGDDGPGIDPQDLARVTQPFERAGFGRGSGLGLAIAGEVARAHHGDLRFRSAEGRFWAGITIAR
jgi:two-component system, OmpR family, sensor histidine kinase TctE